MSLIRRYEGYLAGPWTQVLMVSFICFCCPGMYNALSGVGGSGQVSPEVASNASTALFSTTAVFALFFCGPLLSELGPRLMILIGSWTYPLYSGSLLNFNHHGKGSFVIASGALLGIGAAFLWVAQGAIMTAYVKEQYKGRAIAVFWFIFNVGGMIGSLISFGLNYHSKVAHVNDQTYIAFMVIMIVGWLCGVFMLPPSQIRNDDVVQELILEDQDLKHREAWSRERVFRSFKRMFQELIDWRVFCLIPMFFSANVFYTYQQSVMNVYAFNIRTRSLNSALYWMAQMFGGIVMGSILDLVPVNRKRRAMIGWAFLFITGMAIWGGGLAFERVLEEKNRSGHVQDIDYKDGSRYLGPMFLYMFYGAYDSFWQSYCYWMMGAITNSTYKLGVLVGFYKAFQSTGGAMASRINAIGAHKTPLTAQIHWWQVQFGMNWGLTSGTLLLAIPSVLAVTLTNRASEEEVDQIKDKLANVSEGLDPESERQVSSAVTGEAADVEKQ